MADIVLNNITSGYNISKINSNFDIIKNSINDDVLNLTDGNNILQQDVDMNSHDLLNVDTLNATSIFINGSPVILTELGTLGPGVVNTLQLADGAVTQEKIDPTYESLLAKIPDLAYTSLHKYGCVGDGSDESAKIQAALDSNLNVYIPSGTYIATGLVINNNNTKLFGPGTIKKKANVDGVLLTINASHVTVSGVTFDGSNPQPSLTAINNIINITGNENKIEHCVINTSAGGGITVVAGWSRNIIAYNIIRNTDDNNIMISGANANDNLIIGNYCDTTTQQNNIFVTASPASIPTTDFNYRNRIIGNTCLNAGDTGIEAGIHSVGTVIQGNTIINSKNPEILLRDNLNTVVEGNYISAGLNASSTHDGIALSQQTEAGTWRYGAIIKGNRIVGNLTRSGIYSQLANDIVIEGNSIEETFATVNPTTGVGLVGSGVSIASSTDDIIIKNNSIRHMSVGINTNIGAGTPSYNRFTIENNNIYDIATGINLFQSTLIDSIVRENHISKVVLSGINTNSSSGNNNSYLTRNTIITAGYSGASPSFISNTALAGLFWFTSENSKRAAVPETQFSFTTLNAGVRKTGGTLSLEFEDGTEDAVFGVGKTVTGKIAGTSNLVDSTGGAGSTGWSLLYDGSGNLILQRRAASTGSSNRFFRYRFTQNSNEI